jgi:hypothetical protein
MTGTMELRRARPPAARAPPPYDNRSDHRPQRTRRVSRAPPVRVEDVRTNAKHDQRFVAGLFGVAQDPTSAALRPAFGELRRGRRRRRAPPRAIKLSRSPIVDYPCLDGPAT